MVVPSLVGLCVLALAPYADDVHALPWTPIPCGTLGIELDVHAWTVLIRLFRDIPPALCSFTTAHLPVHAHGFLTVLSLPAASQPTVALLRSTPNLAALDASSTSLSGIPVLAHLRVLFLRNCRQIGDHTLPALAALPLLSVVDLSGTKCTPAAAFPFPVAPSALAVLFQPSIQASLSALASLYDTLPDPLYTLVYLAPRPPKPVPRKGAQDSFVVFSSSSTKIGNTNTLIFEEEHPDSHPSAKPPRHSLPPSFRQPSFYAPRPTPAPSPLRLHRPPPPLSSLNQPTTTPNNKLRPPSTTPASLNLQNHKALLARKGIDAFIKLRSTPSTPIPPPPEPTSSSTKKNPFKKPTGPLKPISSFPPPLLPPSLIPRNDPPKKKPRLSAESPNPPIRRTTSFDWKAWGSST